MTSTRMEWGYLDRDRTHERRDEECLSKSNAEPVRATPVIFRYETLLRRSQIFTAIVIIVLMALLSMTVFVIVALEQLRTRDTDLRSNEIVNPSIESTGNINIRVIGESTIPLNNHVSKATSDRMITQMADHVDKANTTINGTDEVADATQCFNQTIHDKVNEMHATTNSTNRGR